MEINNHNSLQQNPTFKLDRFADSIPATITMEIANQCFYVKKACEQCSCHTVATKPQSAVQQYSKASTHMPCGSSPASQPPECPEYKANKKIKMENRRGNTI